MIELNKKPLGIYVHIPFCMKKCAYCDFLSGPNTESRKASYIEALQREIAGVKELKEEYQVVSIFFGGGTPSSISEKQLVEVLQTIYKTFGILQNEVIEGKADIEITVEVNPGTLSEDKLLAYKEAGVNRLSMGLQSANNDELKLLGRIHTFEEFLLNYQMAKNVGFTNINIDLMSALPGQTMDSYESTLNKVLTLKPTHISAYSLIVEEGTSFFDLYGEGKPFHHRLPGEEVDRQMYAKTKELLKQYGYKRYEISNYAKDGYACRHNSLYWTGVDYIGFGLGASSYLRPFRYSNEDDLEEYLSILSGEATSYIEDKLWKERIRLSKENQMEEFMFLGLRMTKGVSVREFEELFKASIYEIYGEVIEKHINEKLLYLYPVEGEQYLALTEKGLDVSNYVMSDFLLD